jgi:hypothetical protein
MLIRLSDPERADDLCAQYARAGFSVERTNVNAAEVVRGDASTAEQSQREVELHLLVWRAVNPGVEVRVSTGGPV